MKGDVVYILGLFEDQRNPLFQYLKNELGHFGLILHGLELCGEDEFGSYPFSKTVREAQDFMYTVKPNMIIAHSLGAYVAMQIPVNGPFFFFDPSLSITDIISNNLRRDNGSHSYDDGEHRIDLTPEFVESTETMPSIEELARNMTSRDIYIFGAGKAGHKIAEQYHGYIPCSHYIFLPDADHAFSNEGDRQQILAVIKKQLDTMPSRGGGVRTKSW